MIYLASPYSHPDPMVRSNRYYTALHYTARRMREFNELIFSPIVYGHPFGKDGLMGTCFQTWLDFNETMLRKSEEMRILQLPGWEESKGIQAEIAFAHKINLKITRVNLEDI